MKQCSFANQASARQRRKQVWGVEWEHRDGQCEVDVSGRCLGREWSWGDVWAQPWLLVQLMALTEAGLWPYRGERWREKGERGEADRVCLHTEVCCPLSSRQHMAKALGHRREKKIDFHWKNRLEKYPALCLGAGFSDSKCVTPPLTSDIVKCLSAHLPLYQQEAMMDRAVPSIPAVCMQTCISSF